MSAIFMSIFKATAGLLMDKARAETAEMLKGGDVADEMFYNLIVSKIDRIKDTLRDFAKTDLLSSISFLQAGIVNLNQVCETMLVEKQEKEKAADTIDGNSAQEEDGSAASFITEAIRDLKLTDLNESDKMLLTDAKNRFETARQQATKAFSNNSLSTSDRILALKIKLMATILERVNRPAHAVEECKLCIKELHDIPAVQKNFKVQLTGGRKALFDKKERDAIILAVCQVNYVGFRIMQAINGGRGDTITLPFLKVGNESVDVLRDERVVSKLIKLDMAECSRGVWSLGQEGKGDQKLKQPFRLTTNTHGEFIVADESCSRRMKVYDSGGKFLESIRFNLNDIRTVHSLATDQNSNVYVLADESSSPSRGLYVFNKHGTLLKQREFTLTKCFIGTSVAVSGKSKEHGEQVFILGGDTSGKKFYVEVYDALEGEFVCSFGQEKLKEHPTDIAAADDGRVFVLMAHASACVHAFSAEGEHLHTFPLQGGWCSEGSIALGRGNRLTVVVSLWGRNCTKKEEVSIYTGKGDFVCDVLLFDDEKGEAAGHKEARDVAVTVDGRIAVLTRTLNGKFCTISQEHDVNLT